MKRRLKIILSSVVAFFVAILIFIGNYFYGESVKRGTDVELHREDETVNAVASIEEQSLLKEAQEWYQKQNPESFTQQSFDDLLLQADFIRNETDAHKAVILVHGFRKEKADMGDYAKFYYDRDFHILMPDSRGHGFVTCSEARRLHSSHVRPRVSVMKRVLVVHRRSGV